MQVVTSKDGTRIAFWRGGHGPPLLLVHGATADHTTTWRLVLPALEERFTVVAMDRRGRGDSGDADVYDLAREAEDIVVVLDAIGEPAHVFGHSYGALCAIEAARLTTHARSLTLYEGVPLRGEGLYPAGVTERLDTLVASGDLESALLTLLHDVVEMPPDEVALMRSNQVAWDRRIQNCRSMPRELRAEIGYVFAPERFSAMRAPTTLLVGSDSPAREMHNARAIAAGLPNASITVLPGQEHVAMYTAPELFVQELVRICADA